ncbi:hypothetical protein F4780DRAFT_629872 [Xylariomycetidae sp. FL0641]|nr:hypothetical protein F4780DRAFT_629872 [Xylariomycetidae sp. FL0641]
MSELEVQLNELESSGKPLWKLQLPREHPVPPSEYMVDDIWDDAIMGLDSKWRIAIYSSSTEEFEKLELAHEALKKLNLYRDPAWHKDGAAMFQAVELPPLEQAIAVVCMQSVLANLDLQRSFESPPQLEHYRSDLPGSIFLAKLDDALAQILKKIKNAELRMKYNAQITKMSMKLKSKRHRSQKGENSLEQGMGRLTIKSSPLCNATSIDAIPDPEDDPTADDTKDDRAAESHEDSYSDPRTHDAWSSKEPESWWGSTQSENEKAMSGAQNELPTNPDDDSTRGHPPTESHSTWDNTWSSNGSDPWVCTGSEVWSQ